MWNNETVQTVNCCFKLCNTSCFNHLTSLQLARISFTGRLWGRVNMIGANSIVQYCKVAVRTIPRPGLSFTLG